MTARQQQTVAKGEHYDLVSVLYHAMQGDDTCRMYTQDAEQAGDQELVEFFQRVKGRYEETVREAKEMARRRLGQ